MTETAQRLIVSALLPSGEYRARASYLVQDVRGEPVAELSQLPALFVSRAVSSMREAPDLRYDARLAALEVAGELFRSETFGGLDPASYAAVIGRVTGLGPSVIGRSIEKIATSCRDAGRIAEYGRPAGAVSGPTAAAPGVGTAVWTRRGQVFSVHAAGNVPGVHAHWLEALALGWRVAVRPSNREPFTAYRLVSALRAAGFDERLVALLPTDHGAADELVRRSDLSMVYGGRAVVDKYAGDPTVLVQGPGRSKILITEGFDWAAHVDVLADSVVHGGGTGCMNASAIFVEGDATAVARAVADRLSHVPAVDFNDAGAVLPVRPLAQAEAMADYLLEAVGDGQLVTPRNAMIRPVGPDTAALGPVVMLLDDASGGQTNIELPFPCVWVCPWRRSDGIASLRDSLVLSALTDDGGLVEQLVAEPSIRNLYLGPVPTYWGAAEVPHDGYLSGFLMESRGFVDRRLALVGSPQGSQLDVPDDQGCLSVGQRS